MQLYLIENVSDFYVAQQSNALIEGVLYHFYW